MSKSNEKADTEHQESLCFLEGFSMGVLATMVVVFGLNNYTDSERIYTAAYEKQFIDDNGCLLGSPFDTQEGADLVVVDYNDARLIRVIPDTPDTYTPSMLNFHVGHDGELQPDGNVTGDFLSDACEITN